MELLYQLVEKAERSPINETALLTARLFDDMLPLNVQAKIVTNFALRGCVPLVGKKYQELDADIESYSGLKKHILNTIACLSELPQPSKAQLAQEVQDNAGFNDISLPAAEYVTSFVLPNFFFHLSMVYAIAKSCGVAVSKGDFDGIHRYPTGFSWES